ncbi:hypothetical protein RM780_01205 [Streptomyces sp. DSM 44917]|uniref:Lipoprotein n=1 Tax=Streptomyces boetiae TaxID=3075541 RepID=A0ABU2L1Z9_9ACTN|nr:hypothetical protein [Streptomyces sp. DSM 44917]MDT0305584.1 hypothetical protein [Streptomyces sp. DSM 44917]
MAVRRRGAGRGAAGVLGALALGLAAVLGCSGCSGTGAAAEDGAAGGAAEGPGEGEVRRDARAQEGQEAREAVRRVADRLAGAGSSQARTAMQMASGGTRVTLHGEGGFDYAGRVGELRVTLPEGRTVTEVFTPGRLYMKNRGAGVPPEKWVQVETAALPDGNLVTGGATDPVTAAALLRGVRSAEDLGLAEVDGRRLRHYRGVTDIGDAARAAPDAEARRQLTAALGGFTESRVPFDLYVDAEGLPRKVRHHFSFAGDDRRPIDVASTVLLHDFGTPVDVTLPQPSDVYAGAVA